MNAVKVLFASGSDAAIAQTLEKFKDLMPDLPLVVVSEFAPPARENGGEWIPYHVRRRWSENRALIHGRLRGRSIRLAAVILEPGTPHRRMRLLAITLAPLRLIAFNETGQHFRVHPSNLGVMLRHAWWRAANLARAIRRGAGQINWRLEFWGGLARIAGPCRLRKSKPPGAIPCPALAPGISVVIPSRNGKELLAACLPRLEGADEIIVVDNGSDDGTVAFLRADYGSVAVEHSREPLSFAEAANRGIAQTRRSHICLLNNDMLVEPGFFAALRACFDRVPNLFSATAQIFFPEGRRREETGKTILDPASGADFPVCCIEPLTGEDGTWILYGSGGCTLYDAAKLRELGGFDPAYETAYVEDLDVGVRAWRRGWPSIYCAGARVLHQHRATTSRYFTSEQLDRILERNFLRFLGRELPLLWGANLRRLRLRNNIDALKFAAKLPVSRPRANDRFLSLVGGDIAVFPGRPDSRRPKVLVVSPYLPFPLSHGAAVRMYNLISRAAAYRDQILICFVEELAVPPSELTEICCEIVMVRRRGTHAPPSTPRPDTVEEFDSPAFHAALAETMDKWKPNIAQLEFTQMAVYAADCRAARTILVEHDITYDLYAQMLAQKEDWETRRQYERWRGFETRAWRAVDRVVTMSEKDRALISGAVAIRNGVDLERFCPCGDPAEPRRILFIGSFAHRPNVLAVEFFLREVFPRLRDVRLHIIAGQRHERFWDLRHPGVEVEGFVADVRPAYRRASVVVAPLVVSAGTNIKIMEAMAMGKAIVSTRAGIHGLDLRSGVDLIVCEAPEEMAAAISALLDSAERRAALERQARRTAEERFGWDAIAGEQEKLYESLLTLTQNPPSG